MKTNSSELEPFRRAFNQIFESSNLACAGTLCGQFVVPREDRLLFCMAFDGGACKTEGDNWEHVSVTSRDSRLIHVSRTPSWDEMCLVKSLFWKPEECVIQFHPPEQQYVNHHPHVLHLWRKRDFEFPLPPKSTIA